MWILFKSLKSEATVFEHQRLTSGGISVPFMKVDGEAYIDDETARYQFLI